MAISTDLFGNPGNFHRQGQVVGVQAVQQLVDAGAVFRDQRAFIAALYGFAEDD